MFIKFMIIISFLCVGYARIHKLEIKNDARKYIALSTFGFYKRGILDVKLTDFHAHPFDENAVFGFSLDRTLSDAMNPYLDSHQDGCLLQHPPNEDSTGAVIYFIMDLQNQKLRVNCSGEMQNLRIYKNRNDMPPAMRPKREFGISPLTHTTLFNQRTRRGIPRHDKQAASTPSGGCVQQSFNLTVQTRENENYYNANFSMRVTSESDEGLYNLYFHNCANYKEGTKVSLDFTISIEENNDGNYLSAGEMPLPALYFTMALLFFLSGCFWVFILRKSKHPVFKIHYLMAILVYLKSLSLMFHGINYHFIQTKGEHIAAWAILYYIAHLLKGAVLFITIVLVGTGWTFIKHILSEKDKKIFMIVIPLQVLANVAEIIIDESEEGAVEHRIWRVVFILDLLCCGAILFPVVWSIRHLQEASHTDGKAAINLRKLKLFRHFYIMIVCYIYFTRVIVYLLKITVPFQYEWLDEMFREMATYVFFVLTGYKFRPASANPYFQANTDDDDDEEMDVVISQSGLTEGLTKIARSSKQHPVEDASEEEKDALIAKRESSHEYD
ncbi:protein GPR107 isoform X1 [Schistocerca americana]|uniref:protein GPR107 isoform X1 n=1 Tax=Schistocerca americana TaxID=7009 RepID=UPI001F501B0D|nr:protein GPR107 isoform X1 [Schistocerca americana]XP_049939233.1 protein GPR107 isoform X1 [Schistocerca serialis cubense]